MSEPELNYYPEDLQSSSKEGDAFEPAYNTPNVPRSDLNMQPSANGSVMTRDSMQSANFVPGTNGSGWQIKSNGDASFQNVTVNNVKEGGVVSITVVPGDNLQTALDSINTQGGGVLYLSPGTYTLTSDLVVYDNTQIEGDSSGNTTISFGSAAYGITYTGTNVYTTGTLSVNQGSTAVTGAGGASWESAMIGRQIFISNRWYVIANVPTSTSITLATSFADANVAGASYRIADPINNVSIKYVTITASTTNAIEALDVRDLIIFDVVLLANNVGMSLTNFMNILPEVLTIAASTSHGVVLTNGSFLNSNAMASVSNGGSGVVTNNIKSCTFVWSAANSNTADGYNCTDTDSCDFKLECSGNGGQGIEFVSGCDGCMINDGLISGNTSDGIKLTATCDNNTIGGSLNLTSNGGYGINIAAATCDNNIILSPNFGSGGTVNTSGAYADSGTGTQVVAQSSTIKSYIYSTTTNVAVASSTTETTIATFSVPANTLGTAGFIKGRMYISVDLSSTKTFTLKLKYDDTTVATSVITNGTGGNRTGLAGWIDVVLIAAGATNSQEGNIQGFLKTGGSGLWDESAGGDRSVILDNTGTAAEDSTSALNFVVTGQLNNNAAQDTFTVSNSYFTKHTP